MVWFGKEKGLQVGTMVSREIESDTIILLMNYT
jgi:hypothetical protein